MKQSSKVIIGVGVVAAVVAGTFFMNVEGLKGCIGRNCSKRGVSQTKPLDFAVTDYSIAPSSSGAAYKYITVYFKNTAPVATMADLSVQISGNVSSKFGTTVKDTTSFIANDILVEQELCKNVMSTPDIFVVVDKDDKIKETDEKNNTMKNKGGLYGLCLPYNTTRAGFARALVAALGVSKGAGFTDSNYKGCFPDVVGQPYEQAVCYLQSKALVKGYVDGTFKPEALMTRAEAVKLMEVAYETVKIKPAVADIVMPAYSDIGDAWYTDWIQSAADEGITDVKSFAGLKFRPNDMLKNSEGIDMIYKFADAIK